MDSKEIRELLSVTDLMKLGMSKEVANIFMFKVLKPQEEELLKLREDNKELKHDCDVMEANCNGWQKERKEHKRELLKLREDIRSSALLDACTENVKLKKRNKRLSYCLGFFTSVIQSGEDWTETCEQELRRTQAPAPAEEVCGDKEHDCWKHRHLWYGKYHCAKCGKPIKEVQYDNN